MAAVPATDAFPREELLLLLKQARSLFATDEDRAALRGSLHLPPEHAEHPQRRTDEDESTLPRRQSAREFAVALVEDLASPDRLDAAVALTRRARTAGGADDQRWAELTVRLQQQQVEERTRALEAGKGPDIETYRQWAGFECLHHYSLTDRFFGRADVLERLDAWAAKPDDVSVICLCALGGGGKSAVAWRWVNGALTRLKQNGYRGVLWCSFYEKSFDFDEFLKRALAFCAQVDPDDVAALTRPQIEAQLLAVLEREAFVLVIDGLERIMTGYAQVADRALDEEGGRAGKDLEHAPAVDRQLTDPRNGAFLSRLAAPLASRLLITTRLEPAELEAADRQPRQHVEFLQLPGLDLLDAAALWASLAPACPITEELEAAFDACGNHPLAISILARSVAAHGGNWDDWRQLESHAGFHPVPPEARARHNVIETCLRDLGEAGYDLLGVLTTSGKPMPLDELAEVLRQGSIANGEDRWTRPGSVEAEVERLVALGLIGEATVAGRAEYDVHPVIRGLVWSAMSEPRRDRLIDHALSEFQATPEAQRAQDPAVLSRAIALFELLVQTEQWDRAWEMYFHRLWWPMTLQGAYRELLELYELMLPGRERLRLLPLRSRRAQGDAAWALGSLLAHVGVDDRAETLLRWSGAIRLRINDVLGFLDTWHGRLWQSLYEGRLFETEVELRRMKLDCLRFGAGELTGAIDTWIGLVLALRGQHDAARARFQLSDGRTSSSRWWAQGLAEGLVYLDEPEEALRFLGTARATPADERTEDMWESLTRGMAYFERDNEGDRELAVDELSFALKESRLTGYGVIECFALPYLAEIRLRAGDRDEAAQLVEQYRQIDPDDRYRLSAADAWRVKALCAAGVDDLESARAHAARAYTLAGCDGPPFAYVAAAIRAWATLQDLGSYVPRTRTSLPPDWAAIVRELEVEEQQIERALHDPSLRRRAMRRRRTYEAEIVQRKAAMRRQASEEDRAWWDLAVGNSPDLTTAFSETLHGLGIDIAALRRAFEASEHKSLEVVFYELDAARVLGSGPAQRFGELDEPERAAWLDQAEAHSEALDVFLTTDLAESVAIPLERQLDDVGALAFLADCERRIELAAAPAAARRWWAQLEERRTPRDLLILAEAIQAVPATLAELVDAISITGERGLEYAFQGLQVKRAIARQRVESLSRTEGWPPVFIHVRLQAVKFQLGWADLDDTVREFWLTLEGRDEQQVGRVLQLAEELALRGSSISEYYEAYLRSNSDNIRANLCYLDYMRLADAPQEEAEWPQDVSVQRWSYDTATPTFTDTSDWSAEQLQRRLTVVLQRIGHDFGPEDPAEAWWKIVERTTSARTMIRLAEELDARGARIAGLYFAHVDGETDNLVAALAYLDFTLLRDVDVQEATARATANNERANRHFGDGAYDEAIADYERAITEEPTDPVLYSNLAGAWEQAADDEVEGKSKALDAVQRGIAACGPTVGLVDAAQELERWLKVVGRRGGASSDTFSVVTPVIVELGDALVGDGMAYVERWRPLRERIGEAIGVTIPGVRFRGNPNLPPEGYTIELDEVVAARGSVSIGLEFVVDETRTGDEFLFARHPGDGRPGTWAIASEEGEKGLDQIAFVLEHLAAVVSAHRARFLTQQAVNDLLDANWVTPLAPTSEAELLAGFTAVLRGLAEEGVALLDVESLLDEYRAIREHGGDVDAAIIALRMRPETRRSLPGNLPGATQLGLARDLEEQVRAGLQPLGREHVAALGPETLNDLLNELRRSLPVGCQPYERIVLVVEDELVRRYVRLIIRPEFPHLAVMARSELEP